MIIVSYNPWTEMNSLQHQLNKIFDYVLSPTNLAEFGNLLKVRAAELTDTETALLLKLELPGMNVADINIEATAKSISISGERKSAKVEETDDKIRLCGAVSFRTLRYILILKILS